MKKILVISILVFSFIYGNPLFSRAGRGGSYSGSSGFSSSSYSGSSSSGGGSSGMSTTHVSGNVSRVNLSEMTPEERKEFFCGMEPEIETIKVLKASKYNLKLTLGSDGICDVKENILLDNSKNQVMENILLISKNQLKQAKT